MTNQSTPIDPKLATDKSYAQGLYVFHAVSVFLALGLVSFIPLIVNYVLRRDTENSFVGSHHTWMIRSFWWYAGFMIIAAWLFVCGFFGFIFGSGSGLGVAAMIIGGLVSLVAWCWKMVRLIRGFIVLNDDRAIES